MFAVVPDPIPARMRGLNRAEVCDVNFLEAVRAWRGIPRPRPAPDAPILPGSTLTAAAFGELSRHVSLGEIGTSTVQSRALAGMSNGTLVCCLPGSTNACRTAWNKILVEQLDSRTKPCNFVPHLKAAAVDNCGPRS